jgi:hypothetical protein
MRASAAGHWIPISPETPKLATAFERPTSYASVANIQEVREETIIAKDTSWIYFRGSCGTAWLAVMNKGYHDRRDSAEQEATSRLQ